MTAIACYFQREHERLFSWAVGDSRVSQLMEDRSYRTLHDHAVKIFSIPFSVISDSTGRCHYSGSFGYCFSGSSLTALNSHAAFSHLVRVLRAPRGEVPSLREITELVAGVLRQVALSYGWSAGIAAGCECAVLGYCPVRHEQQIFLLRPDTNARDDLFDFRIESLDSSVEGNYTLLGDEKDAVREYIEAARKRASLRSINWYRAPWHGIHDVVAEGKLQTIGGHVQLGFALGDRFEIVARSENQLDDSDHGAPEFLGLDVNRDFWKVGPCSLGLPQLKGLKAFPLDKYP